MNTSPLPLRDTPKKMTFPEAMQAIAEGKRVTSLTWGSNDEYGFLNKEDLYIHTKGKDHVWKIRRADMVLNDYIVLPTIN